MRKLIFVVFFTLFATTCFANDFADELQAIEAEWARAHYSYSEPKQAQTYRHLLTRISKFINTYPNRAEPLILKAILVSTNAGLENSFSALSSIHLARDLLINAINLDPGAFQGSAYVNLGTLYYMVPGWPIAFGDNKKAEQFLRLALKYNPEGLDANYFYGDFLLTQNKPKRALKYLKKASQAPLRPEQYYADKMLQFQAIEALHKAQGLPTAVTTNHVSPRFPS